VTDYSIIKSNRKTICITVKKDLSIEVRAPLRMKQSDIESFVLSKKSWIDKTVKRLESARNADFTYGSKICFMGSELTVTAAEVKSPRIHQSLLMMPDKLTEADLKKKVTEFYKSHADNYLPQRVKEISQITGIKYSSLLINKAKTHWGSCTADRLHLSCFLMAAQEETIDYVIIHELAHTVHHNHSAAFWALVKKHCPEYNKRRNELKALALATAILND